MRRVFGPASTAPGFIPLLCLALLATDVHAQSPERTAVPTWIRAGLQAGGQDDIHDFEDGLSTSGLTLEAGTLLWSGLDLTVRLAGLNRRGDYDRQELGQGSVVLRAEGEALSLVTELGLVYERDGADTPYPLGLQEGDPTGRVEVKSELGFGTVALGGSRELALETRFSAERLRFLDSWWVGVEREEEGWGLSADFRQDHFGADNMRWGVRGEVRVSMETLGAPGLDAGYRFTARDSREPGWTCGDCGYFVGPLPWTEYPWSYFTPVYTPVDFRSHQLVAAYQAELGANGSLLLEGDFGVYASEVEPVWPVDGSERGRFFLRDRTFHPWSLSGRVTAPLGDGLHVMMGGSVGRSSFRELAVVDVELIYRFDREVR